MVKFGKAETVIGTRDRIGGGTHGVHGVQTRSRPVATLMNHAPPQAAAPAVCADTASAPSSPDDPAARRGCGVARARRRHPHPSREGWGRRAACG